jgi:hypothetical protein
VPPDAGAGDLRKLADSLDAVPESIQVVTGWNEIERALYGGQPRPRPAAQAELRQRADDMTARKKAGRDRLTLRTAAGSYNSIRSHCARRVSVPAALKRRKSRGGQSCPPRGGQDCPPRNAHCR